MEISEFISESDTKGMKLFALTQPNPTKKKKKKGFFNEKKALLQWEKSGWGNGQGNNHQVKLTNSVLKNLNIF